jgi:hypothetical protein
MYGDESADEKQQRVFAVAGVLGTEDEWQLAIREWLRRTRGLPFHATECESRRGKTDQQITDDRKLYEDLTKILAESYLVGIAVALDLQSQAELFPDILPDAAYYKCLADVVAASATTARRFNELPDEPHDVTLEFTFDSRPQSNGAASTLYTTMATLPEWAPTGIFNTKIIFEGGDEPRLEMGDLLAREAMKELDRKVTKADRDVRKSRAALDKTQKFIFIEHDRAYCEEWRTLVDGAQGGADFEDYRQWLRDTGRMKHGRPHDNPTNRFLFYAWLENRDALKKKNGGEGGSSSGA